MKNAKIIAMILAIIGLLLTFIGLTYSYFQYRRSGPGNNIRVGRVIFLHTESNTLLLSDVYPIDVSGGIPNNSSNVGTFNLTVAGDTDYDEGTEDGSEYQNNYNLLQELYNNACINDEIEGTICGPWDDSGAVSTIANDFGNADVGVGDLNGCYVHFFGDVACVDEGLWGN